MSGLEDAYHIKTERLLLRSFHDNDAPRMTALIGNWNVIRWLAAPPYPYRLNNAEAFIARVAPETITQQNATLAIEIEGVLAGSIGYEARGEDVHLGYWLGEPYWEKGYMREAVGAVLGFYFSAHNNREIISSVLMGNEASLRLQKSFGFETVGETDLFCVPHDAVLPAVGTRLSRERYKVTIQ